jgi:hypothetical protein
MIRECREAASPPPDLLSTLLQVRDEETGSGGLSDEEIRDGFNPGLSNVSLQLLSEWNESTEPRFAQVKPTPDQDAKIDWSENV